jgi:hypothetical protein
MNEFKAQPQLMLFINNGSLDRKAALRLSNEEIARLNGSK